MEDALYLRHKFEARVDKTAKDGHWIWKAVKSRGYGMIRHSDRMILAHRLSMHLYREFDLNSGLWVLHKPECNNRACVNPDHLYTGNRSDNVRDTVGVKNHVQSRKTHCPQGHPYSGSNLVIRKDGKRACWECQKQAYERKKKLKENK